MRFVAHLKDSLDSSELYHLLEDEMAKYKTLNHKNIRWGKVYEYSLNILQEFSIDSKICNYFVLSCIALDNEESFETMKELFEFWADILQKSPQNLGDTNALDTQKKKLKGIIEHLITEANKLNLLRSPQIVEDLNHTFRILGNILECVFEEICIKRDSQESGAMPLAPVIKQELHTQNLNITSLNDREYRIFFNNLAFGLLERDQDNLSAYALFVEAMWGRIRILPAHKENITQIKYPDKNLIQILLQDNPNKLEHIKCFMSNLALNPFWLEGLKLFCDFLHKHKKISASKLLGALSREFLTKFKEISYLKFSNGELMCQKKILDYFLKQNISIDFDHPKPTKKEDKSNKNLDDILLDINTHNNHSIAAHINALLKMAKLFEEKNMSNNAGMLYIQLRNLMEKTLLKDYLLEDYSMIKEKSEKI